MFTIASKSVTAQARVTKRVALKRSARMMRVAAEPSDNSVGKDVADANAEWAQKGEQMNAKQFSDAIDPADGSIAEAAPLGNDNSMLDNVMVAFKDSRAVEIINGRAAMVGWMLALGGELSSNTSMMSQVFHERTFTLADGVTRTSTYPAAGFFEIFIVVMLSLAASLAPSLKKSSPNGLNEKPETFGPFNPDAEMTNGRGAMIGLVALPLAEKIFTSGSALF